MKTMKISHLLSVCFIAVVLSTPGAVAQQAPKEQSAEARLGHIDSEIAVRKLKLNSLVWECYLECVERNGATPDILNYPGMDFKAVRDTVSEIKRLHSAFLQADSLYTNELRTYPEYEDIHQEYIALKGVDDKSRQNLNKERYNQMYSYLRKNNPDYQPARNRRLEAIRARNVAVVRFLLDYYRSRQREMPVDQNLIYRGSYAAKSTSAKLSMQYLRDEHPEIGRMEEELNLLAKLRREVFEQVQRERLNIPKKKGDEIVMPGFGYEQ
ncbi:hypothetical protein [uncultured Alistipes sp.]|jgi:hypothetical protein|uniref:hypothetical protein n=1 Tax=uncultured Alistipes sp. TaxID=538949 RepID=UPI0025F191A0|nr:hypothetical protein [uncultured Alistipes sp.]